LYEDDGVEKVVSGVNPEGDVVFRENVEVIGIEVDSPELVRV
jgi:hypothetical protein